MNTWELYDAHRAEQTIELFVQAADELWESAQLVLDLISPNRLAS